MTAGPPHYGMPIPFMFVGEEGQKTFGLDESLPSLPVPPLDHSLAKYLESVKPQVSEEDYLNTQEIVRRFAAGVGADLHSKLMETSKHSRNWLENWWEQFGYLSLRIPHAPFVNFGGPGPYSRERWPPKIGTQCERAALVAWYLLQFWHLLRKQRLPIDKGGRTTTWSMYQFYRMFSGCKTPGEIIDTLNHYFKTEDEGPTPTHLLVICKSRFFTFEAVDKDGEIITAPEIEHHLNDIRQRCDAAPDGPAVCALTGENRTTWYQLREHLIKLHPDNERCILTIQTAMFVVVLDDRLPVSQDELSREGLIGDPRNRWFDKTISVITFKNGLMVSNCDHAPHDAMVNVAQSYFTYLALDACDYEWKGPKQVRHLPSITELVFHVDNRILKAIDAAALLYEQAGEGMEIICRSFTAFGKQFIREHNLQPDTFVQMAMHYGYYRLHKRPGAAYETASTRQFYHGRTETLRSCTPEVINWAQSMLDSRASTERRVRLLYTAIDKHNKLMTEAQANHGCDRHLFGMQILAMLEGIPMPDIYTDPSYIISGSGGNFILSTSCVGYTPVIGGVAPMCKNGYGFFYSIEPEKINIFVCRWKADETDAVKLYNSVTQCLLDMKQLLQEKNTARL